MTNLKKAAKAQEYYESCRSKTLVSGFEKYVLTDGENCMFTNINHELESGEALFKLDTRNGNTTCQFIRSK